MNNEKTNNSLTLGSLFDGSGGFLLGGVLSGITPIWKSEIEPFAVAVTNKRFANVKHYGDVSALDGAKLEPVDIITFGSPCQDMSTAGKRAGLDGNRSNLFYQAIRIVKEMRCATNDKCPRYIVWENVPGAFSSNGGEDFKAVLKEICKIKDPEISVPRPAKWTNAGEIVADGFSLAWRVFDAQYWGVPQRRKRIYLVADFTDQCAGEILFESKSLSGDTSQSVCKRKTTPANVEESVGTTGFDGYNGQLTGDVSSTIGVNCGMFTGRNGIVLNDQGGNRMDITDGLTCTLRAEAHHPPCVLEAAGFCTENSAKSRGIGYEKETSPTIRSGTVPAAVAMFENHSQDTRYTELTCTAPTVLATYGTGGNNQPFVVETPQAYGICSKDSNSMKSNNPNSGFYKAETSRTLDGNGGNPSCNQGGIAVVEGNGSRPSHHGDGYKESEIMYTLNTTEKHAVAYGIDRAAFNQGKNALYNFAVDQEVEPTMVARGPSAVAQPVYCTSKNSHHTIAEKNLANTLVATDYKDPPLINDTDYIVRRLTPTECARLQGFPDWWCSDLEIENPTDKDIAFWRDVFETHRKAVGKSTRPKTDRQIKKWLKNPHSDSAEYKLWGNGVALPCVCFVLTGIVGSKEKERSIRP